MSVDPGKICKQCHWFDTAARGPGTDAMYLAAIGSGGRYNFRATDLMVARQVDKHGACTFNPEQIRKYKTDSCGQWKAKA